MKKNPLSRSKSYFSGRNLAKFRPKKEHCSGGPKLQKAIPSNRCHRAPNAILEHVSFTQGLTNRGPQRVRWTTACHVNVVSGVRRRNNGHVCVFVTVGTELAKQKSSAREPEESVRVQALAGRLSRATVFLGFWSVK